MFEGLLNFLIDAFFWIVGLIGSIIIYPIQLIIVTIFPEIGAFLNSVLNFMGQQIAPLISFFKDVVIGITCLPNEVYLIFISFIFARYAVAPAIRTIKLIVNMWKFKSGGNTQ